MSQLQTVPPNIPDSNGRGWNENDGTGSYR
jgi:hypothetical protein